MRHGRRALAGAASAALMLPVLLLVTPAEGAGGPCSSPTIKGTKKADTIKGTKKKDVILAGAGNDMVDGRGGGDVVCAGPGDDTITGGGGADLLRGDGGADTLLGGDGADSLVGGGGGDRLTGNAGPDTLDGTAGNDRLDGSGGADTLLGGTGFDTLVDLSAEADVLTGGDDGDLCTVRDGDTVDCEELLGEDAVLVPFEEPSLPTSVDHAPSTRVHTVDVYLLVDRSGSMSQESNALKSNLAAALSNLRCPPQGTGSAETCVEDLWAGAGTIGYSGSGAAAYQNWVDVQPSPSFAVLPVTEPASSNTQEATLFASYATVTGSGGAAFGMGSVPPRSTCAGSPAALHQPYGYPCFRRGALPLVVVATDEAPISGGDTHHTPTWSSVVRPAFLSAGARLLGVLGSGGEAAVQTDLEQMATETGAVDAGNGATPLVVDGSGANAASAFEDVVRTAVSGVPLDYEVELADRPEDALDARSFVERVEVLPSGTAGCAAGFTAVDTDADTFQDTYLDAPPSTPLCWRVVLRSNTVAPETDVPQAYGLTLVVRADDVVVDERTLWFYVPAA